MTESTLRPGVTMPIPMPYTPTGIQPIPRIMPPARPSLLSRLRTWRHRPSRAELTAGRAVAWARVAELEARVEAMDRDRLVLAGERDQLQEIAAKWDAIVDTADEFDDELTILRRDHLALREEHTRVLVERIAERTAAQAASERLGRLFEEIAAEREAAWAEADRWHTAYAETCALSEAVAPVGIDGEDVELPTLATVTALHPAALREDRTGEISREMVRAARRAGRAS